MYQLDQYHLEKLQLYLQGLDLDPAARTLKTWLKQIKNTMDWVYISQIFIKQINERKWLNIQERFKEFFKAANGCEKKGVQ